MTIVQGGVCAPRGFSAAGIRCGVKRSAATEGQGSELPNQSGKKDLAMVLSEKACTAAAVFTTNRVKAAPIAVCKEHLKTGLIYGIIANSGNANACASQGIENAQKMCDEAARCTGHQAEEFLVASTGVIGQPLNIQAITNGMPFLVKNLGPDGSDDAVHAIMTTDTRKKETAVSFQIGECTATIGGICKGSGMIHPNMGTMLAFLTTDVKISKNLLEEALRNVISKTFNCVSVDGDTSTNDTCAILANGMAGNEEISEKGADYAVFCEALLEVCRTLSKGIAADGEGATKLVICRVLNAEDEENAVILAKSVIASSLVKAAMFGADANWGRILCAMGYSQGKFDPEKTDVKFISAAGELAVCHNGRDLPFDEEIAKQILLQKEVTIEVDLHMGNQQAEAYGCDLTYDYVKINGDYRT